MIMKRYSPIWWLVVLPTSVIVGGTTFLLSGYLTDWSFLERVFAAFFLTFAADVTIAAFNQTLAPTKVSIGPGERAMNSELSAETARVVAGFNASVDGRVSVRGEIWRATRIPGDTVRLTTGMDVNVVARHGLTLVVGPSTR